MSGTTVLPVALSALSLKGLLGSWPFLASALGNGYFFVIVTTILAFVLIGVCLLVKYIPHLFNDLNLGTNSELPPVALWLWVTLIVMLPVFFDAGVLWFVLWWFIVLWGYLNIMERRIAFVFISLVFMSSGFAHIGAGFLTYAQTNVNREMFVLDHSLGTPGDGIVLASWVKNNTADAEPMNVQAVSEMKRGNRQEAVKFLGRALTLEPNNSRFYNHMGIALAGMKMNQEAANAFQNAATLDPDNVVYLYNVSRLHQATYNLYGAEQAIQKASAIDSSRVHLFLDQEEQTRDYGFILERTPVFRQLARQMKPSPELKQTADALWRSALGMFGRNHAMYIGLAVFLILFLLGHIPEEKFTKRCNRCGNLYYAGKTSESGYPICLQCHWLETKARKQVPSVLSSKADEIKKFREEGASRTHKLELILPGLGSLAANKTLKGTLRLSLFSVGLVLLVTGGGFVTSFIPPGFEVSWLVRAAGAVTLGLLYLRSYKSPPQKFGV